MADQSAQTEQAAQAHEATGPQSETAQDEVALAVALSHELKAAREAKQMSLSHAAKTLRIAKKHLQWFESGQFRFDQLDPFQRGYIRNYSELLEVALAPYESLFPQVDEVGASLQAVDLEDHHAQPLISMGLLKAVIGLGMVAIAGLLVWLNL